MFKRLLIANRGEIACRIIHTARKMGITCIAIYSDADRQAQHVRQADEAYRIGPAASKESYLNSRSIIALAQQIQADAIHPGYGFLAENADFAAACVAANIIFIGPTPHAIRSMGHKSVAKRLMAAAGIPLLPSYHKSTQDTTTLQAAAEQIGYPILIKAAGGGGGKGMRIVWQAKELAEQLIAAKREAQISFNNSEILLEKFLINARHIEVQVFADQQGNVIHLFDRDCSIQRRYQKIIEEAPAPNIPAEIRSELYQAAIKACQTINYVGAGTIELLYAEEAQQFYFMEMNTRLQVEHTVTEMITGYDLVEWQFKIAVGEPLPVRQEDIHSQGHAIEVRICAECPEQQFIPSAGKIHFLQWPTVSSNVRIDSGIVMGDIITTYYDSLLAKLIVVGSNRAEAIQHLQQALAACQLVGIQTNLALLNKISHTTAFKTAALNTNFFQHHATDLLQNVAHIPVKAWLAVCLFLLLQQKQRLLQQKDKSPWQTFDGWRLNKLTYQHTITLSAGNEIKVLTIQFTDNGYIIHCDQQQYLVSGLLTEKHLLQISMNEQTERYRLVPVGKQLHLLYKSAHLVFEQVQPSYHISNEIAHSLAAPLPGNITAVFVSLGQLVEPGQALLAIEAMKMEHVLRAPYAGTVDQLYYQVGDPVDEGKYVLHLLPAANKLPHDD